MLAKMCARCRRIIPQGTTYCSTCQPIMDEIIEARKAKYKAKANKKYNAKRNPKYVEFYQSRAWKQLRATKLAQAGYMCEECKAKGIITLAEDVHHKIPINNDWDRRFDIDNLKCLCVSCHNAIHNRWGRAGQKV